MARPTSTDVAVRAGVSRATVSYVLNNVSSQTIPDATRQKVLAAAHELGYRPNLAAKSLAIGTSGIVIFAIPDIHIGELFTLISSYLTTELAARGLLLVVHFEVADGPTLLNLVADLHPRAIIHLFDPPRDVLDALRESGVASHTAFSHEGAAAGPQWQIGKLQVDYLAGKAHRNFAYAGPAEPGLRILADVRFDAVAAACGAQSLAKPRRADFELRGTNAADVVSGWIASGVTAVCAYNDDVALVVLAGIRQAGFECPADLAVVGVDDAAAGYSAFPPLTTVAPQPQALAKVVTYSVLGRLGLRNEGDVLDDRDLKPLEMIVRASS
jgi:DNA-binding LacI/PurR family transcriptional regulator